MKTDEVGKSSGVWLNGYGMVATAAELAGLLGCQVADVEGLFRHEGVVILDGSRLSVRRTSSIDQQIIGEQES